MSEPNKEQPIDFGIYQQSTERQGISSAEMIAIALSLVWVAGVAIFFIFAGGDGETGLDATGFVMTLLAIFLPVAVIWVGAMAARSARIMREESARLQAAIDAMRHTYVNQQQTAGMGVKPAVEKKLDEIAQAQRQTETAIATFTSSRDRIATAPKATAPALPPNQPDEEGQTTLPLGTQATDLAPPLPAEDFILAMNFPESPDDKRGFAALRRALKDRQSSKLIQASQDVLTLLSQEGIYMDDLHPDRSRPEVWRKFAQGERGREIAALGGVRDRSCLALTAGRMRQDPVFRDAAHHFLRQFDQTFSEFEPHASDQEIAELGDTRTARAFMLLGRVTGTFD